MKNKILIKIIYREIPTQSLIKSSMSEFSSFEDLKNKIYEKSKDSKFDSVKLSINDKFILKQEDIQIENFEGIWNSDTYNYFINHLANKSNRQLKFTIIKVDNYPIWNPPKYETILKESLKKVWKITKKEIEEELNEKYLDEGKRLFIQTKKESMQSMTDDLFSNLHVNIICNNCLTPNFSGPRYICSECNYFNLCYYCRKNSPLHNQEHVFIKFNKPILIDIQKFNSIFVQNTKLLKLKLEPFKINIDIINNGENSLKGCFISPIRFGKKYLGCFKKSILEECNRGDKISLKFIINFGDEDDIDEISDFYEGYFRLMTKEGLPFGDIFYIKVIIED